MPRSEKGTFHKAFAVTVTQDGSLGELTVGSNTEQRKLLRERLRWKELRALTSWMTTGPGECVAVGCLMIGMMVCECVSCACVL